VLVVDCAVILCWSESLSPKDDVMLWLRPIELLLDVWIAMWLLKVILKLERHEIQQSCPTAR
jgi:hypothetical protein